MRFVPRFESLSVVLASREMVELARVTLPEDEPRGPDAELELDVAAAWLVEGGVLEFVLPTKLSCARCHGGGCDACGRAGAFGVASEAIRVELGGGSARDTQLRLPRQGVPGADGVARGDLFLTLRSRDAADARLVFVPRRASLEAQRSELMRRSLWMAGLLVLTFVGLLKLSGWL